MELHLIERRERERERVITMTSGTCYRLKSSCIGLFAYCVGLFSYCVGLFSNFMGLLWIERERERTRVWMYTERDTHIACRKRHTYTHTHTHTHTYTWERETHDHRRLPSLHRLHCIRYRTSQSPNHRFTQCILCRAFCTGYFPIFCRAFFLAFHVAFFDGKNESERVTWRNFVCSPLAPITIE